MWLNNMLTDDRSLLALFAGSIAVCVGTYFLIRSVIWSIIWCEIGGKSKKLKKLKNKVGLFDRVKMKYLYDYVKNYQREYNFWMRVKSIYVFVEFVFTFVCITFFFIRKYVFRKYLIIGFFIQTLVFFLIISFNFDHNRNTKYDRMRMNKRNRK